MSSDSTPRPRQVRIPLPDTGGQARVTSVPGSQYVVLEFHSPGRVPGHPEEAPFRFRFLMTLSEAHGMGRFFLEECPRIHGGSPGVHPVRLNPPGMPAEIVVWLTTDQCQTIGDSLQTLTRTAQTRLARAGLDA